MPPRYHIADRHLKWMKGARLLLLPVTWKEKVMTTCSLEMSQCTTPLTGLMVRWYWRLFLCPARAARVDHDQSNSLGALWPKNCMCCFCFVVLGTRYAGVYSGGALYLSAAFGSMLGRRPPVCRSEFTCYSHVQRAASLMGFTCHLFPRDGHNPSDEAAGSDEFPPKRTEAVWDGICGSVPVQRRPCSCLNRQYT